MIVRLTTSPRNAAANAIVDLLDAGAGAGTVAFYTGPQPASAATAVTSQILLGTVTCADPAFGNAADGAVTGGTFVEDSAADASGTAVWCRWRDSNGNTIMDCDVTATGGGGAVQLTTTAIVAGVPIRISSAVFTMPSGE